VLVAGLALATAGTIVTCVTRAIAIARLLEAPK
jgi:hypothetical protein